MAAHPRHECGEDQSGALLQEGEVMGSSCRVAGPGGLRSRRCGRQGILCCALSSSGGGRACGGRKERTALPCRVRRPCCRSDPGPVLRPAWWRGSQRRGPGPGFREWGCALGKSRVPHGPRERKAPRERRLGSLQAVPSPRLHETLCFSSCLWVTAAGPSWVKSSL